MRRRRAKALRCYLARNPTQRKALTETQRLLCAGRAYYLKGRVYVIPVLRIGDIVDELTVDRK